MEGVLLLCKERAGRVCCPTYLPLDHKSFSPPRQACREERTQEKGGFL